LGSALPSKSLELTLTRDIFTFLKRNSSDTWQESRSPFIVLFLLKILSLSALTPRGYRAPPTIQQYPLAKITGQSCDLGLENPRPKRLVPKAHPVQLGSPGPSIQTLPVIPWSSLEALSSPVAHIEIGGLKGDGGSWDISGALRTLLDATITCIIAQRKDASTCLFERACSISFGW
jgi:hypothetical protein